MIDKMPFGKYVGTRIGDLDTTYIAYTLTQTPIDTELFSQMEKELLIRVEQAKQRMLDRMAVSEK